MLLYRAELVRVLNLATLESAQAADVAESYGQDRRAAVRPIVNRHVRQLPERWQHAARMAILDVTASSSMLEWTDTKANKFADAIYRVASDAFDMHCMTH